MLQARRGLSDSLLKLQNQSTLEIDTFQMQTHNHLPNLTLLTKSLKSN